MKLSIARQFARLRKNEDGTQLVETAIWLGIISTITVGAITAMGPLIQGVYERIRDAIG